MQKAAKSVFSSRRLSTVWLWLGAASLLTMGLILVGVNGSVNAEMASALGNQRIHVEKMTTVRRGARSVHVALLERWLYPESERRERQRGIESGVAAVRVGIKDFGGLEPVSAAEGPARDGLVVAVSIWAARVERALLADEGHATLREVRACLDAIDKTSDAVLSAISTAGSSSDHRVVALHRQQGRLQAAFVVVAISILALAIAWWRRYVAAERGRVESARSAQLRAQFFANMSHELRTPLIAIRGLAAIVQEHERSDEALRDAAAHIDREASELLASINNVLDASKLEAGKTQLCLEDVALGPIVSRCVERCRGLIGSKPIAIEVALADDLPPVRVDVVKLQQIMTNLLANSIKYTDRGSICVRARDADDGHVVIDVTDTGVGIRAEALDRVWKPFEQADPTAHRGGTGLGLSIVRSLVDLLGGDVQMESTLGKGTRVTVTLPSAVAVAGDAAAAGGTRRSAPDRYEGRSASPGPIQG